MTYTEQATLEQLGFNRTHMGTGLTGERLWWKRTQTEMSIVRQRDGATKDQDLGEGHPKLPEDTPHENRQWAIDLAQDDLTDWQPHEETE